MRAEEEEEEEKGGGGESAKEKLGVDGRVDAVSAKYTSSLIEILRRNGLVVDVRHYWMVVAGDQTTLFTVRQHSPVAPS